MRRLKALSFLFLAVIAFLWIRNRFDRQREKTQDIDIVRNDLDAGDAHLGRWAQKTKENLLQFRFKRDGSFLYERVQYPQQDTSRYTGQYQLIATPGYKGNSYPRLIAVSTTGDTLINHYVYLTRAISRDVDALALAADNSPHTATMLFYRIKQP